MSLLNNVLHDLEQRHYPLPDRGGMTMPACEPPESCTQDKGRQRNRSMTTTRVIISVLLFGCVATAGLVLKTPTSPDQPLVQAVTVPISKWASRYLVHKPVPHEIGSELGNVSATHVIEPYQILGSAPQSTSGNSSPETPSLGAPEVSSMSTRNDTVNNLSVNERIHSDLPLAIIPTSFNSANVAAETPLNHSPHPSGRGSRTKRIHPLIPDTEVATQASGNQDYARISRSESILVPPYTNNSQQRAVKPRLAGTGKLTSSQQSQTAENLNENEASSIEITHRPLSAEQQLTIDFNTAAKLFNNGNYADSKEVFEDVLARDDGQHNARLLLARLHAEQNQVRLAELLLSNGLLRFPYHIPYVNFYAQLLAEQGRDNAAIDALRSALPGASENADFHALLAGLYQRTGNSVEAVNSYQLSLQLEPTRGDRWMGLGISSEHAGDTESAISAYSNALQNPLTNSVRRYIEQRLQHLSYNVPEVSRQDNRLE